MRNVEDPRVGEAMGATMRRAALRMFGFRMLRQIKTAAGVP